MTPTLLGRWQTRLLLLATLGVLVTLPFSMSYSGTGSRFVFFRVLGYVAVFGVGWDVLYDYLQKFRWDRDWPAVYQAIAGVWEAVFIFGLKAIGLPGVTKAMPLDLFLLHYSSIWLAGFIAAQVVMRLAFPRWRFRGGQWW